ncbi:MAG: tRNA 2-thiouridine synthesizing protein C [Paraglaciecola sp.]
MSPISIAIVNKSAPYGQANGQESLDLAIAAANFGQAVSLFFIDDGVFQLLIAQAAQQIDARNYSKTFAALTFYDIDDIYVCQQSLTQRNLTPDDLCIPVKVLSAEPLQKLLALHQHLVSF